MHVTSLRVAIAVGLAIVFTATGVAVMTDPFAAEEAGSTSNRAEKSKASTPSPSLGRTLGEAPQTQNRQGNGGGQVSDPAVPDRNPAPDDSSISRTNPELDPERLSQRLMSKLARRIGRLPPECQGTREIAELVRETQWFAEQLIAAIPSIASGAMSKEESRALEKRAAAEANQRVCRFVATSQQASRIKAECLPIFSFCGDVH